MMFWRLFIILITCHISFLSQAGILEWQETGPAGGDITEILMPVGLNNNLFAASSYGVYTSKNKGLHWSSYDSGLKGYRINNLAWQDSNQLLYASAEGKGIFRRSLFDKYWVPVNKGLPELDIIDVITTDSHLFVSTERQGVFSSIDQGDTWQVINQGLEGLSFANFVLNLKNQLYIATSAGVFRFDSNKQIWQAENVGLIDIEAGLLQVDSQDNLYVFTKDGLYKRVSNDLNWQKLSSAQFLPAGLYALVINRENSQHLLAAARNSHLFISQDGGKNWDDLGQNGSIHNHVQTITQDNKEANLFYLGLRFSGILPYDGVSNAPFFSAKPLNRFLNNTEVIALANHPLNPRLMYASVKGISLFKSNNNGISWEPVRLNFQDNKAEISAILTFPNNEDKIFVATTDGYLFSSENQAKDWQNLGNVFDSAKVYALHLYKSPQGKIVVMAATSNGLYRTIDDAKSWETSHEGITDTDITALYISSNPSLAHIFSVGTRTGAVYHSINFGSTWTRQDNGLADNQAINILMGSNRDAKILYAGTDSGLYFREDPNQDWQKSDLNIGTINDIKMDVANNNLMLIASDNGVYRSNDAGLTWKSLNDGLKNRHVLKIALSPRPLSIYAGTRGNGIYNLHDFSLTEFTATNFITESSNNASKLASTDITDLQPEAFNLFDETFLSTINPAVMQTLTAEQISNFSPTVMAGFNVEQLNNFPIERWTNVDANTFSGLSPQVIGSFTPAHLDAIYQTILLELSTQQLGRFCSLLNPNNFTDTDINFWLPDSWSVDLNSFQFKAAVGANLALPDLPKPEHLSAQIRLPNRLPNLRKNFAIGGNNMATSIHVLDELNDILVGLQLSQYSFTQNEDGLLQLTDPNNPNLSLAFIVDINNIRQLSEQTKTGFTQNKEGQFQLNLASKQRINLIPAPKSSQSLLDSLGGEDSAALKIGESGDVIFNYNDSNRRASQVHRVVVFDSTVETVDETAGIYEAEGESLLFVYNDGTAQLAYAAVPYPELFIETAFTFAGVEIVTCNTDGSCNLQYEGVNYRLSPELDILVTELGDNKVDPSIGFNSDGSLLYTVQDQTQSLGVTIRISF